MKFKEGLSVLAVVCAVGGVDVVWAQDRAETEIHDRGAAVVTDHLRSPRSSIAEIGSPSLRPEAEARRTCESSNDLRREHSRALEVQSRLRGFIGAFGAEISREQNMTQSGSLSGGVSGSLEGSGIQVQLGNVQSLLAGVAGFAAEVGTLPIGRLYPMDPNRAPLVSGLAGFGFGRMSLKGSMGGSVQGSFSGSGYHIHDKANVFVIPYLEEKTRMEKVYLSLRRLHERGVEDVEAPLRQLENLLARIPGDEDIANFAKDFQSLESALDCMKLVQSLAEDNGLSDRARAAWTEVDSWAREKRFFLVGAKLPADLEPQTVPIYYVKPRRNAASVGDPLRDNEIWFVSKEGRKDDMRRSPEAVERELQNLVDTYRLRGSMDEFGAALAARSKKQGLWLSQYDWTPLFGWGWDYIESRKASFSRFFDPEVIRQAEGLDLRSAGKPLQGPIPFSEGQMTIRQFRPLL